MLIFRKVFFFTENIIRKINVKFLYPQDIKEDFFYLNLHEILHLLMPNLLVLYLILGLLLNLPSY